MTNEDIVDLCNMFNFGVQVNKKFKDAFKGTKFIPSKHADKRDVCFNICIAFTESELRKIRSMKKSDKLLQIFKDKIENCIQKTCRSIAPFGSPEKFGPETPLTFPKVQYFYSWGGSKEPLRYTGARLCPLKPYAIVIDFDMIYGRKDK